MNHFGIIIFVFLTINHIISLIQTNLFFGHVCQKFSLRVLLSFRLNVCQFHPGIAYKSAVYIRKACIYVHSISILNFSKYGKQQILGRNLPQKIFRKITHTNPNQHITMCPCIIFQSIWRISPGFCPQPSNQQAKYFPNFLQYLCYTVYFHLSPETQNHKQNNL